MLRVQAVASELERRIDCGEYAPGEQLPTESALAVEFGVSRTTIRGAVGELQAIGIVSREQGRGTFVRGSRQVSVSMLLEANLSVSDVIRSSGFTPGTTGLSVAVEPAPSVVINALRLAPGSTCLVVRRTRTADAVPAADSTDYLLSVPSLPHDNSAYEHSIYKVLEAAHHRPVETGIAQISAARADGHRAKRLEIDEGSPVLILSQVHELTGGIPVMYSVIALRNDVVKLSVHRGFRGNGLLHESEHPQRSDTVAAPTSPHPRKA